MKKPKGYELVKFKFLNGGGVSVKFEQDTEDKTISNRDTHTVDSPRDPHDDFTTIVDSLKGHFADVFSLRSFNLLTKTAKQLTAKEQQAADSLKSAFDKMNAEIVRKIEIVSVELTGEEDTAGIIIQGKLEHNGYVTALKTPVLKFTEKKWGFEDKLNEIMDAIEEEVNQYLFENKSAEPDLFGENNGKPAKEEPNNPNLRIESSAKKDEAFDEDLEEIKVAM